MAGGRFQGDLLERTFEFSVAVLTLVEALPHGTNGWVLGKQLARSGTSVGANIREADHAITDAEFVNRCSIARKEASESEYWLLLCQRMNLINAERAAPVIQESHELVRILTTIVKKTQRQLALTT